MQLNRQSVRPVIYILHHGERLLVERKDFFVSSAIKQAISSNPSKSFFFHFVSPIYFMGHTYTQLSDISGYSIQHLSVKCHQFVLQEPPIPPLVPQIPNTEAFLLLDGLWLKRGFVLVAYRQSKNLTILHISVVGREVATNIAKDLQYLGILGYQFTGSDLPRPFTQRCSCGNWYISKK